jgi:hypothetical protein
MLKISKPDQLFPFSGYITNPNVYNHENWIQQQEELFTVILNEILEPALFIHGPWSDDALEAVLSAAFDLYQSDNFQTIRTRLFNVMKFCTGRVQLTEQGIQAQATELPIPSLWDSGCWSQGIHQRHPV